MSASNPLSPKLFHGSAHFFGEGDIIEPKMETLSPGGIHAFATESQIDAKYFGGLAAKRTGQMFAPVYEVTPVDPEEKTRHPYGVTTHISKKGFKPGKIVDWGTNPEAY
jgi:hypothetical protein